MHKPHNPTIEEQKLYIIDRVNIDPITKCWLWALALDRAGYGISTPPSLLRLYNKPRAHQLSYCIFKGPIPSGIVVRHKCRNTHCCNPEHLELGTIADNNNDRKRDGTNLIVARGSKQGLSKLTEANVREIRKLAATGKYNQTEIAKMFNVASGTISQIVARKSWSWLED